MKKSTIKNRINSLVFKEIRNDGLPMYHFSNLEKNEKPTEDDLGKYVFYAGDVHRHIFDVYMLKSYYYLDNGNLCFSAFEMDEKMKGSERNFYQTDLILIPEKLLPRYLL